MIYVLCTISKIVFFYYTNYELVVSMEKAGFRVMLALAIVFSSVSVIGLSRPRFSNSMARLRFRNTRIPMAMKQRQRIAPMTNMPALAGIEKCPRKRSEWHCQRHSIIFNVEFWKGAKNIISALYDSTTDNYIP